MACVEGRQAGVVEASEGDEGGKGEEEEMGEELEEIEGGTGKCGGMRGPCRQRAKAKKAAEPGGGGRKEGQAVR
jgi:hypothetical protein